MLRVGARCNCNSSCLDLTEFRKSTFTHRVESVARMFHLSWYWLELVQPLQLDCTRKKMATSPMKEKPANNKKQFLHQCLCTSVDRFRSLQSKYAQPATCCKHVMQFQDGASAACK